MKLLLWDCRSLWPIFILFCVRLRKFQRWVRLCELTTRWSPGHVKFVCPLIILACWFHGIFRSDLGYESGRKNLWGLMFQRTFTNTKNILKINKKTGSLFCWCVCNCICRQSPQGHSQEKREPLTLAGGLEEAWLLSYVGSHGTRRHLNVCSSLSLFCFASASSQKTDVLSGAFPAGKGRSAPEETSVDVSCSSLGQEQPLQEATMELQFLPCILPT